MTLAMARTVLLWCTILNYGLLLVWCALLMLPHGWLHRLTSRFFRMTIEQFELVQYAGIVFYKVLVLVFNLIPLLALWIIG